MLKIKSCEHCDYFQTGDLDHRVKWMSCTKGHRLISDEQYTEEYHPFNDPNEKPIRITWDSWTDTNEAGQAMLGRIDCSDWKHRSFKLGFKERNLI